MNCKCTSDPPPPPPPLQPDCQCPRDELDIVIHCETCLLYKNEKIIHPHDVEECECQEPHTSVCQCCGCLEDQCTCKKAGREALDEWRRNRNMGHMPEVLESTHPLMQKFQESLRHFLQEENDLAAVEIKELRDELKLKRTKYDQELEDIYRSDHDTNGQRVLIQEYEAILAEERKKREEVEEQARVNSEKYKVCKEKLDAEMICERDSLIEIEALSALVRQMESWREETESDLTISQRVTDKMRKEKRAIADDKRQLDMIIYGLNNEVWKLQAKLELLKKQLEIKNSEMDKVVDRVTTYSTELEDLDLDKKRLISLWNAVLVNIKQRDKVFDSVRDDYRNLQENYRTLVINLQTTKKMNEDEMNRSKELAMNKDKLDYDMAAITKIFDAENQKREEYQAEIARLQEMIDMTDRDMELVKMENLTMNNILTSTEKEFDYKTEQKLKLEAEILQNLQDCLLNNKAVEAMANGIKKMRDMSRNLEISLAEQENQHAKIMLSIEIHKGRQSRNTAKVQECQEKVRAREKELEALEEKYEQTSMLMLRKQRELDIVLKKYNQLKEMYDTKSPQERRIIELEQQIKALHERTESMQHEWLRLQGHVVKLTTHHQKLLADISLINKQIQICDQKTMITLAKLEQVREERAKVERVMRDLRGRMEVLERARKDRHDQTDMVAKNNFALSQEYAANLKDAENELMEIEEEIEQMDKEKVELTQQLDHVQREALVWQRKGILAVELRRNIKEAKSAAGEIGQMKNEIHRMEVRRDQLQRTAEKLADDLAQYVMKRRIAVDRTRATAAVEKARGHSTTTSQSAYKHKLRLVKSDVTRVTKELADANAQIKRLQEEQSRLEKEIQQTSAENAHLEESIASTLRECRQEDRDKQWLLERVVRCQRVGNELQRAVKRQSLRIKEPKKSVLSKYNQSRALNDRLRYIVGQLGREYPYMEEKLEMISNTLNIVSPTASPRLTEDATCDLRTEEDQPGCVIPEEPPEQEPAEKPYCRQGKDTCIDCKCVCSTSV